MKHSQSLYQNSHITLYSNVMWLLSYWKYQNKKVLCTIYQWGTHAKRSRTPLDVSVVPYKKTAEELTLVNSLLTLRLSRKQGEAVANFRRRDLFLWCSAGDSGGGSVITDTEIKALSETLYVLDSNKALPSQLIIDPQALVSDSQTSSKTDLSSRRWHWQCTPPPPPPPRPLPPVSVTLSSFVCLTLSYCCFQSVRVPRWELAVLQTHLRCFSCPAGQLQEDDRGDGEIYISAAGRAGHLSHGDHVQHWAGQRAVCFPLHQG